MYNDLKLGIIELQYYLNGEPKEDKFHGKGCLSDLVKKISKNWKMSEDDPLTIKWNNEVVTPSNYNCFLYEYRLHCFYISEFGNMLFDFQDVISFDVGFQLSIDKKLSILHAVVSPASQYSAVGSLKQAQISELKAATSGIPIFHHRGQANASTGHHVSIYYDGFGSSSMIAIKLKSIPMIAFLQLQCAMICHFIMRTRQADKKHSSNF